MPRTLRAEFYAGPTLVVARELIGKVLVHETRGGLAAGVIVETEAYIGEGDPACHAAPGPTARNAPLYGRPGVAYVYLNYGIHYLVNAVTEPEGSPAAVLIRALEPVDGEPLMRRRRARGTGRRPAELRTADLCRGPGNLTRALGITLGENWSDLTSSALRIEDRRLPDRPVAWTGRVGITVGVEQEWRCLATDSPAVSRGQTGVKPRFNPASTGVSPGSDRGQTGVRLDLDRWGSSLSDPPPVGARLRSGRSRVEAESKRGLTPV